MKDTAAMHDEQAAVWNGPAGESWVAMQDVLDGMFQPFEAVLIEAACDEPGNRVLDVGCGAGAVTRAIARKHGACTGVDISRSLVELARARAQQEGSTARFVCADAAAHAFEPAGFDAIVSRFGVMFFADPVAAFARLRLAARADARLCAVAWRDPSQNPFMTAAERGAAPLLPAPGIRSADAPGQFAFADRERVRCILEASGWRAVEIHPLDVPCRFCERDLLPYLTRMGPLGRLLPRLDQASRARAIALARAAFEPFVHGDEVRFTAACWRIEARAG